MAKAFVIGLADAGLFVAVGAPMSWLLGPLFAILLTQLLISASLKWYSRLRTGGLVVAGYVIGYAFTLEARQKIQGRNRFFIQGNFSVRSNSRYSMWEINTAASGRKFLKLLSAMMRFKGISNSDGKEEGIRENGGAIPAYTEEGRITSFMLINQNEFQLICIDYGCYENAILKFETLEQCENDLHTWTRLTVAFRKVRFI